MASKSMSCQNLPWRHDVQSISWRQKSSSKIRQDVRKFALTSKYSSWCKHTSWWQNARHYFKRFVKKTSSCKNNSWHQKYAKCLSWSQKYVMTSNNSSWLQKVRHYIKKTSRRPRVSNDYEFSKNLVTNIRPIPVIFLDNFGMSVYSFVTIRPHFMVWYTDRQTDIQQRHQHYNNLALRN